MSKSESVSPDYGNQSSFEDHRQQKNFDRMINLSDGIFAFAMTLLALDLVTPVIIGQPSDASLSIALENEFHSFLGFLVSFWVIAMCWVSHHRIFSYVARTDSGLLRLNLIYLFFIVLIPFATRVLNYGFLRVALDVFALILIGASLMSSVLWRYVSNPERHLLYEGVSQDTTTWLSNRGFVGASVFLVSIFFAFVNPYITLALWFLEFPILILLDRRFGRRKASKDRDEKNERSKILSSNPISK